MTTDLIEENAKLRKENKRLLNLLTSLTEQTEKSVEFWRRSYMTLATRYLPPGGNTFGRGTVRKPSGFTNKRAR